MRTVTRKGLEELATIMPVVSEMNQKMYVGGTSGSTGYVGDCTGYTGVTGTTGCYEPVIYDGGCTTGYMGGNYGSSSSSSSGSTGYYGTTGVTGYNDGSTGSYTGNAGGYSGCSYNSGTTPSFANGGSVSSPYAGGAGNQTSIGEFDSGTAYSISRPCSYSEYCIHLASGTWAGGYVQGMEYQSSQGGNGNLGSKNNSYTVEQAEEMMNNGTWKGGYVAGYDYMYPQVEGLANFKGGNDLTRRDLEKKLVSGFSDIAFSVGSEFVHFLGTALAVDTALLEQTIDGVLEYMETQGRSSVYEIVKVEQKPTYGGTYDYVTYMTFKYFDRSTGELIKEVMIVH